MGENGRGKEGGGRRFQSGIPGGAVEESFKPSAVEKSRAKQGQMRLRWLLCA